MSSRRRKAKSPDMCKWIESYDWSDWSKLEDLARCIADSRIDDGRIKRLFSQLATCTKSSEAKAVIAFHYYRLKGKYPVLKFMFLSLNNVEDEEYRLKVLPKIRPLFNFVMFYKRVKVS